MGFCVLLILTGVASSRADTAPRANVQIPICAFGSTPDSSDVLPVSRTRQVEATGDTLFRPLRRDPWLGRDKFLHGAVSAGIASVGYLSVRHLTDADEARSRWAASLSTLGIGLLKEERDRRRPDSFFSVRDLLADLVGIGVGLLVADR